MTDGQTYLVVGGDSLVGGGVMQALQRRGHQALASTRRRDTLDAGRIYLDFEDEGSYRVPKDIGYAFVIAAATNYDRCEKDPMAQVVNVRLIPQLVAALLAQGVFVTFISTNSVFGGERPWPHEDDPHAPGIAYARQKSEGEEAVRAHADQLGAAGRLNIVRLTKIMNAGVSPLPAWFDAWRRGQPIEPFSDLVFAPISVRYVGEALATIGEKRIPGHLHLSGAANVTYVDLAAALAPRRNVAPTLIRPTTATEKGINIPFKPRFSGLGMARTTELTALQPQSLDHLADDLVADLTN